MRNGRVVLLLLTALRFSTARQSFSPLVRPARNYDEQLKDICTRSTEHYFDDMQANQKLYVGWMNELPLYGGELRSLYFWPKPVSSECNY